MPAALSLVSVELTFAMMAAESALAASCASAACWSTPPRARRERRRLAGDGRPCDGGDAFGERGAVGLYQTHRDGEAGLVGLVGFLHYERLGEGRGHHLAALPVEVGFLSTAMPLGSRIA